MAKTKILIVKLSSLGDLFHALPAVHCLRDQLKAEVDWCVQSEYVELVRYFTDVSRVIAFPRKQFFREMGNFLHELRRAEYDMVIDCQGLLKSAVVTLAARGKRRIGPSFSRECASLLIHERAQGMGQDRHAVERIMDVVRHLGLKQCAPCFPVKFPTVNVPGKGPHIGILAASRWPTKNWPSRCFVETIKLLRQKMHVSVHLLGSAADSELYANMAREIGTDVWNHSGAMSMPESGGLLDAMDLVIANDTGPVHMAAAVATPCLVLFGPTDARRTGPYGSIHKVLTANVDCRPCMSRSCRKGTQACLNDITPERVASEAYAMLIRVGWGEVRKA